MRVVYSSSGGPAFKRILVKIFEPGNKKPKRQLFRAQPGKVLNAQSMDQILAHVAHQIENVWYVGHDYRFVPVGQGEFNFVHEDECAKCRDELETRLRAQLETLTAVAS